jgi:hypothetical protein
LVVVSLFLPSRYRVERRLTMKASPEAAFPLVNTLRFWPEWTTWTATRFPDLRVSFAGPEAGVGATATWEGKRCGFCTRRIVRSELNQAVAFDLAFQHGQLVSQGEITLKPSGELLTVVWTHEGELGWSPVARFLGLLMDKMMGPELEQSLRNLQARLETVEDEVAK